jgi:hypothetical protein
MYLICILSVYLYAHSTLKFGCMSNGHISSLHIVCFYLSVQVDLEQHKGFLGGLQQNKSTGDTAPYYATSTCEIVYHVSTRIPIGNEESRHIKVCLHLWTDV